MKYLFISNVHVLLPLLDFDICDVNIDLHNNFACSLIEFKGNSIEFYFKKIETADTYDETNAVIVFSEIFESNLEVLKQKKEIGNLDMLTNFARGELTDQSKYHNNNNVKYFFIDFLNGSLINIFCKEAIIFLW